MTAKSKKPRTVRRASAASLDNAAMAYLQRYSASEASLRQVLAKKLLRAAAVHPDTDIEQAQGWIDEVVAKCLRLGLIDDDNYAGNKARALRERGDSARQIRAKLSARGIAPDRIDRALEMADVEAGTDDTAAAWRLAQRRRLGPYRLSERAEHRQRDLAALARAGYGYDIARQVIDGEAPE